MAQNNSFPSFGERTADLDLWFEEKLEMKSGSTLRVKIKRTLWTGQSPYQNIAVLETKNLGRMLALDGIIMLTEFDEFAYHEMIVHVPLIVHPNPASVLVIGGGDGGTVREIVKHPQVEEVHLCEIDSLVVKVSKEYLPGLSSGFEDPRVTCFFEDGTSFIASTKNRYDVIIVDSSDPVGPAIKLFHEEFYKNLFGCLKPDGLAVTQCESCYYHGDFIHEVLSFSTKIFPVCGYYFTHVPTYPSGQIGFAFCSKTHNPINRPDPARVKALPDLRYYSSSIHLASFVLPRFAARKMPPGVINETGD